MSNDLHGRVTEEQSVVLEEDRGCQDHGESRKEIMEVVNEAPTQPLSPVPRCMLMEARVNGQLAIILVDSGASGNFVPQCMVENMAGVQLVDHESSFVVCNGDLIRCTTKCLGVLIEMQRYRYLTDCIVLPTNYRRMNVILGVPWLHSLGDITWNFKQLKMKFMVEGQEFRLQGLMNYSSLNGRAAGEKSNKSCRDGERVIVNETPTPCIPQKLVILGSVNHIPALFLIDSGRDRNYISTGMVAMMEGGQVYKERNSVTMPNGDDHLKLSIEMQGYCCLTDFTVLPSNNIHAYVILGVPWLHSLGEIMWNFQNLKMRFMVEGQEFMLRGMDLPEMNSDGINYLRDHVAEGSAMPENKGCQGGENRNRMVVVNETPTVCVPLKMMIPARVNRIPALTIIDSGCSANYISVGMVERMEGCQVNNERTFTTVNGDHLECTSKCLNVSIKIQEYRCLADCIVLPKWKSIVILGVPWLHSLGNITWNFQLLKMKFTVRCQEFTLQGLTEKRIKEMVQKHGDKI